MKQSTDHTYRLVLAVHNNPGVLVRCAQVFNRRGHNIEALHVTSDDNAATSDMTITAFGDPVAIRQITLQLQKLIDVVSVTKKEV